MDTTARWNVHKFEQGLFREGYCSSEVVKSIIYEFQNTGNSKFAYVDMEEMKKDFYWEMQIGSRLSNIFALQLF